MGPSAAALLALVAAADPESFRTALDVGIATEGRSRSVDVADRPPILTSELQVAPLARAELATRRGSTSVTYNPRIVTDGVEPRYIHDGRVQLEWRPARTWTLRGVGSGAYGIEPRPGASVQPEPGFAIQVSPVDLVKYVRWEFGASVEARPTRRWRLDAGASWRKSGGLGESESVMPAEEGPRVVASAAWSATRRDVVGALADASATSIAGAPDIQVASLQGTWKRGVVRNVDLELAAGAGAARSNDGALGDVRPTGRAALSLAWPGAVARAETAGALETTIVVDRYSGQVRNRHEARLSGGWAGQGGFRVDLRVIGALQTDGARVRDRVGALEARASFRVTQNATAIWGARASWQESTVQTISSFTEWGAFVGVALADHRVFGGHPAPSDSGPEAR